MHAYEKEVLNYYREVEKNCPTLSLHSRNLNWSYVQGKLDPCYHREEIIRTIQKILLRKNKANIMLTGQAGCGKTALVEGLAAIVTEDKLRYTKECLEARKLYKADLEKWEKSGKVGKEPVRLTPQKLPLCDYVIYEVSLNGMVGGTKYRGEFEERLEQVIIECRKNPNIILFIDECHHMCRVGAGEGSVSIAQILKPALARGDIRVIGATTPEEKTEILSDKAFARRFTELEIPELRADAVQDTAERILKDYCSYHKISTNVPVRDILSYIKCYLPGTVFPDNYINVVDETLAGAVLDGQNTVTMCRFTQTLSRMTGHVILCADELGAQQVS